eukprot:jgi/Orpsp1_1/1185620/evm.model.c7180000094652.1
MEYFDNSIANLKLDEFISIEVEISDTYKANIIGKSDSYCWDNECLLPSVK